MNEPTTTLNIRGMPVPAARQLKANAAQQGVTLAGYLVSLVKLHEATKAQLGAGSLPPRLLAEAGLDEGDN